MEANKLTQVIKAIVLEQKSIIGPLAIDLANQVNGITVSKDIATIQATGDASELLTSLVTKYEKLFGKASVEACKDSLKSASISVSTKDLPAILQ